MLPKDGRIGAVYPNLSFMSALIFEWLGKIVVHVTSTLTSLAYLTLRESKSQIDVKLQRTTVFDVQDSDTISTYDSKQKKNIVFQ